MPIRTLSNRTLSNRGSPPWWWSTVAVVVACTRPAPSPPDVAGLSPDTVSAGRAATVLLRASGLDDTTRITALDTPLILEATAQPTVRRVTLPADLLARPGSLRLTVQTQGGTDTTDLRVVATPASILQVTPQLISADTDAEVTLTGEGFVPTAQVRNGAAWLATRWISTSSLSFSLPAEQTSPPGWRTLALVNGDPSLLTRFEVGIRAPVPAWSLVDGVLALHPDAQGRLQPSTLGFDGGNLATTTEVQVEGADAACVVDVTSPSRGRLSCIPSRLDARAGDVLGTSFRVRLWHSPPGGGATPWITLRWVHPTPVLTPRSTHLDADGPSWAVLDASDLSPDAAITVDGRPVGAADLVRPSWAGPLQVRVTPVARAEAVELAARNPDPAIDDGVRVRLRLRQGVDLADVHRIVRPPSPQVGGALVEWSDPGGHDHWARVDDSGQLTPTAAVDAAPVIGPSGALVVVRDTFVTELLDLRSRIAVRRVDGGAVDVRLSPSDDAALIRWPDHLQRVGLDPANDGPVVALPSDATLRTLRRDLLDAPGWVAVDSASTGPRVVDLTTGVARALGTPPRGVLATGAVLTSSAVIDAAGAVVALPGEPLAASDDGAVVVCRSGLEEIAAVRTVDGSVVTRIASLARVAAWIPAGALWSGAYFRAGTGVLVPLSGADPRVDPTGRWVVSEFSQPVSRVQVLDLDAGQTRVTAGRQPVLAGDWLWMLRPTVSEDPGSTAETRVAIRLAAVGTPQESVDTRVLSVDTPSIDRSAPTPDAQGWLVRTRTGDTRLLHPDQGLVWRLSDPATAADWPSVVLGDGRVLSVRAGRPALLWTP